MTAASRMFRELAAHPVSRRGLLRFGAAGVLGWSLPDMLAIQARAAETGRTGRAKSVLVILEQGGLSHVDTWDPKPGVVADHRSPFKPVTTNVPGMFFTELLSKTAKVADKLAVVRSMYHPKGGADGHPLGTQYALSGEHPGAGSEAADIGSVVSAVKGSECPFLPSYVMVPGNNEQAAMTRTGSLSSAYQVFKTGGKDVAAPDWQVKDMAPRPDNAAGRLSARRELLNKLENDFTTRNRGVGTLDGIGKFHEQAFDALSNPKAAAAFDLRKEPDRVRAEYGEGHRGACYLVGRRLIEAGVRFVTVDVRWPTDFKKFPKSGNMNWDHHDFIYSKDTCDLPGAGGGGAGRRGIGTWEMMGSTDTAFAALIADMDRRGLLADTLVCFVSEFGRTPKINKFGGRDHHTKAYSIVFAGAGVPGGQIIGTTDAEGGTVTSAPHTPEDYACTIYEKLGIDRAKPLYNRESRPFFVGHGGAPIAELF